MQQNFRRTPPTRPNSAELACIQKNGWENFVRQAIRRNSAVSSVNCDAGLKNSFSPKLQYSPCDSFSSSCPRWPGRNSCGCWYKSAAASESARPLPPAPPLASPPPPPPRRLHSTTSSHLCLDPLSVKPRTHTKASVTARRTAADDAPPTVA